MSVMTIRDASTAPTVGPAAVARLLVVAWQHPHDRAIQPVGMLSFLNDAYEFYYIRNAQTIPDFRPLLGFPDLQRTYRSSALFPLFAQRAMDPRRPDFRRYVSRLGLPDDTTPWEQIARSGGRRTGDTLQLFPVPTMRNGLLQCAFLVHGIRHIPARPLQLAGTEIEVDRDQLESTLAGLSSGSELLLVPEPCNPHNRNALLVADGSGAPFGYVPDLLIEDVTELRRRTDVRTFVDVANDSSAPWHLRVLAHLSAPLASDFAFFTGERWQPIAS